MVVSVKNFAMKFGETQVISDLSFEVNQGDTFGFLGSNGSGKTTTLRALLGMLTPTSGTLEINGKPFKPGSTTQIGYLPEERGLYRKETVTEVMNYFAQLRGFTREGATKYSRDFLERVGLAERAKVKLGNLSGGQQQKIQLGVALMGEPDLLILDEPTKGFDPVNRKLLIDLVAEQQAKGATVILVTHQMDEVERLCNRVLLLLNGNAEAYGTLDEVKSGYGTRVISVRAENKISDSKLYKILGSTTNETEIQPIGNASDHEILSELIQNKVKVSTFEPRAISMDEIFVTVYGRESSEETV